MERVLVWTRRLALHTSAAGFSLDFAHSLFGKAMILVSIWENTHEIVVPYAAFAATLIVYIDGYREKCRDKGEAKASPSPNLELECAA